jgi:hypothetical protein
VYSSLPAHLFHQLQSLHALSVWITPCPLFQATMTFSSHRQKIINLHKLTINNWTIEN